MTSKEEIKKEIKHEIIDMVNNIENPYWLAHVYKYIASLKKKENI